MTRPYPHEMPARVTVRLKGGRELELERRSYEGFHDRPMSWDRVVEKFERLSTSSPDASRQADIVAAVRSLDTIATGELTALLGRPAA